jgi:hypothetical protein
MAGNLSLADFSRKPRGVGAIKTVGQQLFGVRRQAKRDAALGHIRPPRDREEKRRRASLAAALHIRGRAPIRSGGYDGMNQAGA